MHILFTPSNYPSKVRPTASTFVRPLVLAMARAGARCSVIAPIRLAEVARHRTWDPKISYDTTVQGNPVKLIRPKYPSFSKKSFFGLNSGYLSYLNFRRACVRALKHLDLPPDIIYGHFLYAGGATAVCIGCTLNIPSCVRVGESGTWSFSPFRIAKVREDFKAVSGLIANSEEIKDMLLTTLKVNSDKILTIPNGVDRAIFHPRDRRQMRIKHDLPGDKFLIAFVGHFDERKGPHRLLAAVEGMDDIGLIFIGSGAISLEDPRIVYKGRVVHALVPEYLSAADIFVLPTLAEGSCNAAIEALACGLPVISSDRSFNQGLDDTGGALLVDPENIAEIRHAILSLKKNTDLRRKMSCGALEKGKQHDIQSSALFILKWLQNLSPSH